MRHVPVDPLMRLVQEAALGLRRGWTLAETFDAGGRQANRRAARRREHLLRGFGHETRLLEEEDTEAVYLWRRT